MAGKACKVFKKGHPSLKAMAKPKASTPPLEVGIVDNGDQPITYVGVDSQGNPVDLTGLATVTATSSDPSKMTVDIQPPPVVGVAVHTQGPLTVPGTPVVIEATITANDGSFGPFVVDADYDIKAGGPTGAQPVLGAVTTH